MNVWICVSSKLARNLRLRIYFIFSALRAVNQSTPCLWPPSMTTVNAMLEPSLFPESLYWGLRDSQGHFRCFICATCCIFISCLSISYPSCWFFLWKCIVTWLLFYPVCLIFTLHGSSQMSPSQRPALNPPESTSPIFFFLFLSSPWLLPA